jgi:hypothetical protein
MAQGIGGRVSAWSAWLAATLASLGCVPQLGAIDGKVFGNAIKLSDPRFGATRSPGVPLQIEIADHGAFAPAHVGHLVHDAFFKDSPGFRYNVAYACGKGGPEGGGYTDPQSIWFNVFVGYYEIDVPKATWGRPFGYRLDAGGPQVEPGDVLRIGKADWDYFSNYLYGVPLDAVQRHAALSPGRVHHLGRQKVGAHHWDFVSLSDVEVVSAYLSDKDGQRLVENSPLYTGIWRDLFGAPFPRPEFSTSFFPTRMHGELYMSFTEGLDPVSHERMYRTTIFGGTINQGYPDAAKNRAFLDAQLGALRKVMEERFPDLGFR